MLPPCWRAAADFRRWPMPALLGAGGLAILCRVAPRRSSADCGRISPDAILATVLWPERNSTRSWKGAGAAKVGAR